MQMDIEYVSKHPTNDGYLEDHRCFPITLQGMYLQRPMQRRMTFLCVPTAKSVVSRARVNGEAKIRVFGEEESLS